MGFNWVFKGLTVTWTVRIIQDKNNNFLTVTSM